MCGENDQHSKKMKYEDMFPNEATPPLLKKDDILLIVKTNKSTVNQQDEDAITAWEVTP